MKARITTKNIARLFALLITGGLLALTLIDDHFASNLLWYALFAVMSQLIGAVHLLACWGISKTLDKTLGTAHEHTLRLVNTNGAMHGALSVHDDASDKLKGALSQRSAGMLTLQ